MAAQEERTLKLLVELFDTRILQLQRQVGELEQARTELVSGEAGLERIEADLDQALNNLRTRIAGLDRGRAELEQAGNEQRIGQEGQENLKIQLARDAKSLQELKATFLNHTRAFTEEKNMLALYRGLVNQFVENASEVRANPARQGEMLNQVFVSGHGARVGLPAQQGLVDQFVESAMEVQENPVRHGEMLNQDFVRGHGARVEVPGQQDPGLGKSFVICCSAGVMYLLLASLLVYKFFDDFTSTKGGNRLVDAFCMTSVTTFTIGYGDILPREVFSKILCDALAVVGHVVPFIFCHYMDRMAQRWDSMITSTVESERLRLLYRVLSAIVVILVVIFAGVAGIYIFERGQPVLSPSPSLSPAMAPSPTDVRTQSRFWDIFHLSVMTVTSTGYGDVSFVTVSGRSFAIFWIPVSVTIYSVAIAYLTRHTLRAFRVHRYITGEH